MTDYIIINLEKTVELGSLTKEIQNALNLNDQKNVYIRENKLYIEASNTSQNIQTVNDLITIHDYTEEINKLKNKTHEFLSSNIETQIVLETLKNIGILTTADYNNFTIEYKRLHQEQVPAKIT